MSPRTSAPWLNYLLGLLCVGAIVAGFMLVGPASSGQTATSRTAKAAEGVVQSTVSGSGTLEPASKVGVDFAASGTLTGVFVSVGDHVKGGELLAEINPASAESSLRSAEIAESSDEAAYRDAIAGLTPAEARQAAVGAEQSRASVSSAKQSLRQDEQSASSEAASARASIAQDEVSLKNTEQSVAVEAKSQQDALGQDVSQRGSDEKALAEARGQVEEAKSLLATEKGKSPPNEQKISSAESKVAAAESTLRSGEAKVNQDSYSIVAAQNAQAAQVIKGQQSIDSARNTVSNANRTRASTELRGKQTIAQARTSLASQELSLQSTLAANEVKAAPPKPSTLVSAENSVKSAQLTLEKARQTLAETKLYAPTEGVVAQIKNTVGESVTGTGAEGSSASNGGGSSASGSTGSSSSGGGTGASAASAGSGTSATVRSGAAASGGASGSGGTGTAGASATPNASGTPETGARSITSAGAGGVYQDIAYTSSATSGSYHDVASSSGGAASGAGTSGASSAAGGSSASGENSSSSAFIELVDVHGYQLVVPLSESEIAGVHVGQIATVTVEALEGRKFAAEVVSLPVLSTSSSGVVSYDVSFALDQVEPGLRPGMSATAEVVVKQQEGVNVPTSAITANTVTVLHQGKQERRRVVTGLQGNSSTIISSGLKAGEEVALPVARTTSSSSGGLLSRLGSRLGGGALGGGGGALFRGGG
jgi:multidrug efflux pump subunit AcrA (membrane-fusion protein)